MEKYYLGEPVNIHIQSFINVVQEKYWSITTKKGDEKSENVTVNSITNKGKGSNAKFSKPQNQDVREG